MTARVALLLAWVAFCIAVGAAVVNVNQRDTLTRVEHRLDHLETTTTTRPVRAQANQPSRPTTIGACVIVHGFAVKMSDEDAARVGGRRCGQ